VEDIQLALQRVAVAMARLERAARSPAPAGVYERFPSLWGMSARERSEALRKQAAVLANAGWSEADVGYVIRSGTATESRRQVAQRVKERLRYQKKLEQK
jgi:hypothetical protein